METTPVDKRPPVLRPAIEQGEAFGGDKLHRQHLRQFGHFVAVTAVDAHFTVALTAFAQADRHFAIAAVIHAGVKNELRLVVTDHAPCLQTAKSTAVPERIHRLEHARFTAAIGTDEKVKTGRRV